MCIRDRLFELVRLRRHVRRRVRHDLRPVQHVHGLELCDLHGLRLRRLRADRGPDARAHARAERAADPRADRADRAAPTGAPAGPAK